MEPIGQDPTPSFQELSAQASRQYAKDGESLSQITESMSFLRSQYFQLADSGSAVLNEQGMLSMLDSILSAVEQFRDPTTVGTLRSDFDYLLMQLSDQNKLPTLRERAAAIREGSQNAGIDNPVQSNPANTAAASNPNAQSPSAEIHWDQFNIFNPNESRGDSPAPTSDGSMAGAEALDGSSDTTGIQQIMSGNTRPSNIPLLDAHKQADAYAHQISRSGQVFHETDMAHIIRDQRDQDTQLNLYSLKGYRDVRAFMSGRSETGMMYWMAQLLGGKEVGFYGFVAQLGYHHPTLLLSPVIESMLRKLARKVDKDNLYKIAIVSDAIAAAHDIKNEDHIRLVPFEHDLSPATYVNVYEDLINDGYQNIISIHLSEHLCSSYRHAKAAAEQIDADAHIQVFHSRSNGLSLGLMIHELHDAIRNHYSVADIERLMARMIRHLQYWVYPVAFDYYRSRAWLNDIIDEKQKMKFKLFKNKPILRLERNLSVVGTFHEDERALDSLYHLAENYIKSNRMRIHRVGIEYRGAYREAIGLKNKVAAIFPRKQITLSISGSATAAKFGPRLLAICIV